MVSTIANGGIYLPPRVLMPGQVDGTGNSKTLAPPQVAPQPFKPGGEVPNPLPAGAHRVLSTMTSAQMRKMMEGVVLYGTGKAAQLNGYSSGGKTGTAQKIDPATHGYSKTMHVASFAGIAPVNNPVIAVAVVMDNPKGGSYYGAAVSAPIFAEVAQQVLEYLSVPHDIDLRSARYRRLICTWPKTPLPSIPATSMQSSPRSTICPRTIPCGEVAKMPCARLQPSLCPQTPVKRSQPMPPPHSPRQDHRKPHRSQPLKRSSSPTGRS